MSPVESSGGGKIASRLSGKRCCPYPQWRFFLLFFFSCTAASRLIRWKERVFNSTSQKHGSPTAHEEKFWERKFFLSTQDGMKHPEMHKQVKVRKKKLDVTKKKWVKKNFDPPPPKLLKIARAAQKSRLRGGKARLKTHTHTHTNPFAFFLYILVELHKQFIWHFADGILLSQGTISILETRRIRIRLRECRKAAWKLHSELQFVDPDSDATAMCSMQNGSSLENKKRPLHRMRFNEGPGPVCPVQVYIYKWDGSQSPISKRKKLDLRLKKTHH